MLASAGSAIRWDNHVCMPLNASDTGLMERLREHRRAGFDIVSVNIAYDIYPASNALLVLAAFRHWISENAGEFALIGCVEDIHAARAAGKLGVVFDIEGGRAIEDDIALVGAYARLGVKWMLLAYNKNNSLGGGCQDQDPGLSDKGRLVIRAMERAGMLLCCSHTGRRTAREAIEYSRNPVIFSHSNPAVLCDHPRNVPDSLIEACARTGGVFNLSSFSVLLGGADYMVARMARHIDHCVQLVGAQHVGIGSDFVFNLDGFRATIARRPDIFPAELGYDASVNFLCPAELVAVGEELRRLGYGDADIDAIFGMNNLRLAEKVWAT